MPTLYEIGEDANALRELLEEITTDEDGNPREPTQEEKYALIAIADDVKESFEKKAERILRYRANMVAEYEMFKVEEQRLQRHKKAAEKKAEALKWLLEQFMIRTHTQKTTAGVWTLRMQKNPPSLFIKDERLIPDDFKKVEVTINKKELLQAIKDGLVCDGADIQQFESLRIV